MKHDNVAIPTVNFNNKTNVLLLLVFTYDVNKHFCTEQSCFSVIIPNVTLNTFWDIHCHYNQTVCEANAIVKTDFGTLITKSTEQRQNWDTLVIDVDIDCQNRIEKFKVPLEANELCF